MRLSHVIAPYAEDPDNELVPSDTDDIANANVLCYKSKWPNRIVYDYNWYTQGEELTDASNTTYSDMHPICTMTPYTTSFVDKDLYFVAGNCIRKNNSKLPSEDVSISGASKLTFYDINWIMATDWCNNDYL